MEKKFKALNLVAIIFKILGIIVGLITIISTLGICLTGFLGGTAIEAVSSELGMDQGFGVFSGIAGIITSIIGLILGAVYALMLYGLGELINVLLAIEENTRPTTAYSYNQALDQDKTIQIP